MGTDSGVLKMHNDPLQDCLQKDESAFGVYVNSPYMVELAAHVGFDWVMIDQMFTDIGWKETANLLRTAEAAGITPVVRAQSNPWLGYDDRIAVDVTRNLGLGAKYVLVSNSGEGEIEECLEVAHDWHRKALHIHPFDNFEEWDTKIDDLEGGTHIIPHAETVESLEGMESLMRRSDVDIVFIAMTDASRELLDADKPDWNHPDLWEFVDHAVELGKETDTIVGANTSYAYSMEEMTERAVKLHDHGVRMIMTQGAPFLFQVAIGEYLDSVHSKIEGV